MRGALAIATLAAVAAMQPGGESARHAFDYDRGAPLDVADRGVLQRVGSTTVRDLSYASPKGGRVPAYLVVPSGAGPFAAIVFVHWGQGNRSEFLAEAVELANRGAISLLIDAPSNRIERDRRKGDPEAPEHERDDYVQLVVDVRRGVDLLLERRDVDATRIGYVGHSLGATWGGALAGVERRIKAFVLMGGLPTLTDRDWPDPVFQERFKSLGPDRVARSDALLAPINPINFVGDSDGVAKLFQFARVDRFISERAAQRYFDAAAEPKTMKWYFCSHEFNDAGAARDRDAFLRARLALR